MLKIGYIDDSQEQFGNYARKLARQEIQLIAFETNTDKSKYIEQIYRHQVEAILIDYKMVGTVGYNGSALVSYISDIIPDMTCFIMTAVERMQITDQLVANCYIYSKTIFDTEAGNEDRVKDFQKFVDHLKDCAEVFKHRRELKCEEYEDLLRRKQTGGLSVTEEEELCRLYRVLSSYGMVEKLPETFLHSDFEKKLDTLLQRGKALLENK